MQKKYGPKGVVLLALSYEPASLVKPYVKKHGMSYIVGGGATAAKKAYGIRAYPTYFVIDPDGKVTYKGHSHHDVEKSVKKLLKENPPKWTGSLREGFAKAAYRKAGKLYKKRKYAEAIKAYDKIAKSFEGTKYGGKAKSKLKRIKSNEKVMARVRRAEAKKTCENWLQLARALVQSGKRNEALDYYERIVKEFPRTRYAEVARDEMADL